MAAPRTPSEVIRAALLPGLSVGIADNRVRRIVEMLNAEGYVFEDASTVALAEAERSELIAALTGMLTEWDKFTRYGSPMAKSANEPVAFARAALAKAQAF